MLLLDFPVRAEDTSVACKSSATEFDWVQLTSGEWLKGEVKSMYNENIEFDRDKFDLLTIDLEDINNRITAGVGIGCTIINTHNTE